MYEHWPLAERYSSLWVGGSAQQIEMFGFRMCRLIYYLVFSSTLTFHCGCFHFRLLQLLRVWQSASTDGSRNWWQDSLLVLMAPSRNRVSSWPVPIHCCDGKTWSENTHSEMLVLRKKPNSILVYTSWSQTLLFAEHCRRPKMVFDHVPIGLWIFMVIIVRTAGRQLHAIVCKAQQ